MTFLKHIFNKHRPIAISIMSVLVFATLIKVFASGPFAPGAQLDPDCTPGSGGCIVSVSSSPFEVGTGTQSAELINTGTPNNASGPFSLASGLGSTASAPISIAVGNNTTASGPISTAFGSGTIASSPISTAFGSSTTASGPLSTAFGASTTASGSISMAFGSGTTASGSLSTAFGDITTASGAISTAFGANTSAVSNQSIAAGDSMTVGTNSTDAQRSVGFGLDGNPYTITTPSIFSIMGGSVGIGTVSPSSTLSIVGTADISGNLTVGSCTGCGGGGGWSLTGNAGTNSATNFIGTTDDVPFNIRVHNEKAGRIDEGDHNTFLGFKAGNANVTGGGLYNTGIGHSSLLRNTTGLLNIAIGFLSLENNTTGFGNVGVGYDALSLNDTGNLNTAIGHSAGAGATGSGNVFLGAQAGQGITADNQLWIDNANNATPLIFGNFSSRNVGIGTITPGSKLSVVGLPVYADDAAAGTGGLSAGDFYQTNGAGAITTAGVVMVKQ